MYTETQLNDLLKQLENEFTPFLAKAEAESLLAKSEDSEKKPEPKEEDKPEEGKAEAEGDKAAAEAEEADGKAKEAAAEGEKAAADAGAVPEGKPEGQPEGEVPAEAAPQSPDCDYDEDDHAHMADMYGSMSPGELKAHHDAIRKCLDAQGGMAKGNEVPAAAPVAPEMQKSEKVLEVPVSAVVATPEAEVLKSELAANKAELDELKKSSEVMKQFITKLFDKKKAPAGKAITDLGVLEKSELSKPEEKSFTKPEITKILTAKVSNPTLAKSDRTAINQYYTSGQVNVDSIRHLLK